MKAQLDKNGIEAHIKTYKDPRRIEFLIRYDQINDFIYGIKSEFSEVPKYVAREDNLPDSKGGKNYIAKAYFGDYRMGYDTQFFTKEELIADVLKHYERYLGLISKEENELFVSINANANRLYNETKYKEEAAKGEVIDEE